MDSPSSPLHANVERFSGFADRYDAYRPTPPSVIVGILMQLAETDCAGLVVDIGSGTGLSTRIWAGSAQTVIGVEPNPDMRAEAVRRTAGLPDGDSIRYQDGTSTATGLPEGCADIVTCSQALHWMEPEPTFAEIARILRRGGVFAAYDCDWPPTMRWEAEVAFTAIMQRGDEIGHERGLFEGVRSWSKTMHLERMQTSGLFRYTKEIAVHHVEQGDAERLAGLALSQGNLATLLKHGVSEAEIGVETLLAKAERSLGSKPVPWYWTYRVRMGIK